MMKTMMMMKKIKLLIGALIISVAFIGCSNDDTVSNTTISERLCETGFSCLYIINDGEVFKKFKNPKVIGTESGIIVFEDSRGRTHFYNGPYYIIYKDSGDRANRSGDQ